MLNCSFPSTKYPAAMEIILESNFDQAFKTKVVGVTYSNTDGTLRQNLLKDLKEGEPVYLIRDRKNEHSKYAVAVYNQKNQQLGYLPDDNRLSSHMDMGGETKAFIFRKLGGPSFFERLFGQTGKSYGLILEVTKGNFDWKKVAPIQDEDKKIASRALSAKNLESSDPAKAIEAYLEIIESIKQFDCKSDLHQYWRRVRLPVDRISLLYDKAKQYDKGISILLWYFSYEDVYPPSPSVLKTMQQRLEKMKSKISKQEA
ncbi:HIRAN domain-containing protein [Flammeovirgaceae bacterium 311]|nr:HIRAN domain-containing protein [Flammeovirgaceae bacterium 311]